MALAIHDAMRMPPAAGVSAAGFNVEARLLRGFLQFPLTSHPGDRMADPAAPHDGPRRSRTILVVDSDEAVRTSLCRTLRESGYAAVPARDAAEAQWCAGHPVNRPDLVLVDAAHPHGDAWHFGASLEALRPYVPIIAMADFAREEGVKRGLIDLRTPFLRKPVCPSILVRTVGSVLSTWRARPLS